MKNGKIVWFILSVCIFNIQAEITETTTVALTQEQVKEQDSVVKEVPETKETTKIDAQAWMQKLRSDELTLEDLDNMSYMMSEILLNEQDTKKMLELLKKHRLSGQAHKILSELGMQVAEDFEMLPSDAKKGLSILAVDDYTKYLDIMLTSNKIDAAKAGAQIAEKVSVVLSENNQ